MSTTISLPAEQPAPVSQGERILVLDSLRGIAILGILLMNIPAFGLPYPAVFDFSLQPQGDLNYFFWYVFGPGVFEGSQRGIFSMLFGTGMFLFLSRLEKRVPGMIPAEYYLRRQLWLLLFGIIHAYVLVWFWDILYSYAICGIILFVFRRQSPRFLLIAAGICLVLMTLLENKGLYKKKAIIAKGEAVALLDTSRSGLTAQQQDDLEAMTELKKESSPEEKQKKVELQLRSIRGDFSQLYGKRFAMAEYAQTKEMYHFYIWDVLLFMLIGLAFYKMGVMQGEASTKVYGWMTVAGLLIGLPLSYLYVTLDVNYQFNYYEIIRNKPFEFYELQRTVHSFGIFGLIMLMYKSGWFRRLFTLMRPVGQMAFTNYITQSILCGLFFTGIGLGYFGRLEFYQLYYVVAAVWALQIAWSHLWLKHFRFGPLEWLWRSLTYWKRQPMRKEPSLNA